MAKQDPKKTSKKKAPAKKAVAKKAPAKKATSKKTPAKKAVAKKAAPKKKTNIKETINQVEEVASDFGIDLNSIEISFVDAAEKEFDAAVERLEAFVSQEKPKLIKRIFSWLKK